MDNQNNKLLKQQYFDEMKTIIRQLEAIIQVAFLSAIYYYMWRISYRSSDFHTFYGNGKFVLVGVYAALIIVLFYLCDSFKYGHLKFSDIVISQWISIVIVNIITYCQLSLIANHMLNPIAIIILTIIDCITCSVCVYIFTYIYHHNNTPKNMVLIYENENAINLKFKMDTRPDKYRVTKVINVNKGPETIQEEISHHDAVIINDVSSQLRNNILKYCYERGIRTYVVPKISDIIARGAEEINLFDTPLLLVKGCGLTTTQRIIKRMMDIILCIIALIPSAPIMLIVATAIKLEDHGPVFYKQKRVTHNGKTFDILKFRSMIVDAEKGYSIPATGKDPRITKVGNIIRACRVDELPQILNILKGDMSIVGPRPERVEHVTEYCQKIPEFAYRTKVKGGLTGYAQIYGKYNTSAYDKVRLDLMYIENYSILLDIKLIFMTLQILVRPESTEGFEKIKELEKKKEQLLAEEKKVS